jgi:large subunit ribosomal protein L6
MSRIGKKPVPVPNGVSAAVSGQTVTVKGPKGELSFTCPDLIAVEKSADGVAVSMREDSKTARSLWGMSRTQIVNLIEGVTKGYNQTLEIHGVGFRAAMKGKDHLQVQVGFSHDVVHKIPAGVEIKVGQMAAEIRAARPPEPYQGKGIRYQGEFILRKEGKKK